MSLAAALQALRLEPRFMRNVTRWVHLPARPAEYAAFPAGLNERLSAALASRGLTQLYTHQHDAVAAALRGEHVAVVTPAASGKTLCYNLPVLHHLLTDPHARALYLFPTKALAHDQLAELNGLLAQLRDGADGKPGDKGTRRQGDNAAVRSPSSVFLSFCATYDGDTPAGQRARVRDTARIILTNPDMLHMGILPQHPRWAAFFAQLRVVVIDEMHMYRGVFGSHVANVLRRLRRICRFYGGGPQGEPQFLLASATIANPHELAEKLVEAPVTIVGSERNGAPRGEQQVIFYNPPLLDPALGIRRSSHLEAADLAARLLAYDVQTIVFARTRLTTELILTYLQERHASEAGGQGSRCQSPSAGDGGPSSAAASQTPAIRGYRGGYLPMERRAIERGLRDGTVRGVVATNALELGIDIGQLDAAILTGYPGTIASARQQMGRAGRRQGLSVGVLVATADPLDQYLVAHPEYLLERSPEHARLNPDNAVILAGHLACAAAELPFEPGEAFGRREVTSELLRNLVEAGQLYCAGDRYYWAGAGSPAASLSLRSSSPDRLIIQARAASGAAQAIGEMDRPSVPLLLYEGAVYLHEGASYQVERLDWENGIAHVRPADVDFYTRPSISETVEVLVVREMNDGCARRGESNIAQAIERQDAEGQSQAAAVSSAASPLHPPPSTLHLAWGDVRVVRRATGYRIIRRTTGETLGFGPIDLPEQTLETQGCWLALPDALVERLKAAGVWHSAPNDYGPNWPAQREAARRRDGYRCQHCGAPESGGRQHDVHHRIPFRAFGADPRLRGDLPAELAWQAANVLDNLVTLCHACHRRAEASVRLHSGLGGVANLLAGVAPIFLMCDSRDLGVVAEPQAPASGLPTITIYEQTPGGVGYAEQLYRSMPELLSAALELVQACPCEHGCPSCVGPVLDHDYALDAKSLARAILEETGLSGVGSLGG